MATSAFKSTSRRGNESSKEENYSPQKILPRRSRSVSAFSRNPSNISSEFSIRRDNPLFCSGENEINSKFDEIVSKFDVVIANPKANSAGAAADSRRGRSVSRNADYSTPSSTNRKVLPKVDTGRRGRSVSRPPMSRGIYVNSESEVEQECGLTTNNYKKGRGFGLAANDGKKVQGPNWEDTFSTSSLSEAEEKTIKAVFEQMKPLQGDHMGNGTTGGDIYETVRSEVRRAISDIHVESAIRRSNIGAIATSDITDIPPELVNPSAVELVLDIRSEYAKKLEQSQERARKLRADLEVEEHRGQELSRILKEILPNPKALQVQKPRPGRKASIERRKMSKRLTEEAMAYFDECVSLSTFDSSDFSSPEDPPINVNGVFRPIGNHASLPQESTSSTATYYPRNCLDELGDKQELDATHNPESYPPKTNTSNCQKHTSDQATSTIGTEATQDRKFQFSFVHKPAENFDLQHIRDYAKNFEKEMEKDDKKSKVIRPSYYDADEYKFQTSMHGLLSDKVRYKNMIESGSLLVCNGGMEILFSPFA